MRRKPLAAVLALLSAALVLGGNALLDAGWGSALRSIADRVLPNPSRLPEPGPRELLRRRHRRRLRLPGGRGGRQGLAPTGGGGDGCERPGRGCARGSGPLSAAQVQCRREFQEVEHGEDTGSG